MWVSDVNQIFAMLPTFYLSLKLLARANFRFLAGVVKIIKLASRYAATSLQN